ncbi:MAG: glycosyltransferase [Polyangiaceae bacterium]
MPPRPAARRVAFFSTSFPRDPDDPSGHFVRAEGLERAREGWEVHVFCPGEGPPRQDGPLHVWPCGGGDAFGWPGALSRLAEHPSRGLDALAFAHRTRRRLRREGPWERCVGHFLLPSLAVVPGVANTVELVGHGSDVRLLARLPGRSRLVGGLLARGVQLRFVARALMEELAASLAPEVARRLRAEAEVAPSPISMPELAEPPPLPEGFRVVLCGRLVASKRFDQGLAAVARAGATAIVVGDGPARRALEAEARRQLPPERVSFLGQRGRRETLAILAASHALLAPSPTEGAPTVIREARCLGLPVVSRAAGDVVDWARRDHGILVAEDPRDPVGALARALAQSQSTTSTE